jgi:hypothetical protein
MFGTVSDIVNFGLHNMEKLTGCGNTPANTVE